MRQITITAPQGSTSKIASIAFAVGIEELSVFEKRVIDLTGLETSKDSIEMDMSTPMAKTFLDELVAAPFFSRDKFTIAVRQPRSLVSRDRLRNLTRPLVGPTLDIFEELWQFSQVTYGFIGRIFTGALLLSYGLVEYRLLFIIAGLLFIPLLPLLLSIGFGLWTKQWRLAAQGLFSLSTAIVLLLLGGIVVALFTNPPVRYSEFNSHAAGFLVSIIVGVAAGLATADDVGRRELIGLAATAQIAIIPAWFGLCLVLGFPASEPMSPSRRVVGLLLNIVAIVIASLGTYATLRVKGASLDWFKSKYVDLTR